MFDGGKLSAKSKTEKDREKKRNAAREEAEQLMRAGNVEAAQKKYSESIDVTPRMARSFILVCRELGV